MVREYPRYETDLVFGLISTARSNVQLSADGKSLLCGGLETVFLWNVRQEKISKRYIDFGPEDAKKYEVCFVCFSPDEESFAAGYTDGSVRIFETQSGDLKVHFYGHDAPITHLTFDASGTHLCSASKDNNIVIWDISAESGVAKLKDHVDIVNQCTFLCGDRFLLSCSKDSFLKIWDLTLKHCIETVVGPTKDDCICFSVSQDETRIACGYADGSVVVYALDAASVGKQIEDPDLHSVKYLFSIKKQSKERIASIKFHPDLPLLIVQNNDKSLEIYKIRNEKDLKKHLNRKKKSSQGENAVLVPADEIVFVKIVKASAKIRSFDFLPLKKHEEDLVFDAVCALFDNSFEVIHIDASTSKVDNDKIVYSNELAGHRSGIKQAILGNHQDTVACVSSDMIKIWNAHSGSLVRTIECKAVSCAIFLPNDRELAVGTKSGELEIYDIASGALLESIKAHSASISSLTIRPDHRCIASGSADKEVKFWELELVDSEVTPGLKRLSVVMCEALSLTEEVLCVKYSPNQRYFAVSLLDSTIKVFFVDSLKFYLSLYGHKLPCLSLDISHDSKFLVSASSDKNIKIWGLDFGDCHKSIFAHQEAVTHVSFVGEQNLFISCSKDRVIKMWDAENFQQVTKYEGHFDEVWSCTSSARGEFFISASLDRSIRRWTLSDDPIFLCEEREKELDELMNEKISISNKNAGDTAAIPNIQSLTHGEKIIEAIDMCDFEISAWKEYHENLQKGLPAFEPAENFRFRRINGDVMSPEQYLFSVFAAIPTPELESTFLVLPFKAILVIIRLYLEKWFAEGCGVNLTSRILFFILKLHGETLALTKDIRPILERIKTLSRAAIDRIRDDYLFNYAGLTLLKERWESEHNTRFFEKALMNAANPKKNRRPARN